jgi:hypothetical protein
MRLIPAPIGLACALALGAVLGLGCGGDLARPSETAAVRSLAIEPSRLLVAARSVTPLLVKARDSLGRAVPLPQGVVWSSTSPAVASVDAVGRVTAQALGTATIRASLAGLTAVVECDVQAAGIQILANAPTTLVPGASLGLQAVPVDILGTPLPPGPPVTWTSSDPLTVSVRAESSVSWLAVATALRSGSVTLTATVGRAVGQIALSVQPELSGTGATLAILSFRIIEFQYPQLPDRYFYAPDLRLAETSGTGAVDVVRMDFTIPGLPSPVPPICTAIRVDPGSTADLFRELYGDYPISFDSPGHRATGDSARAVLHYTLGGGGIRQLLLAAPVVQGSLPTTYTGGTGAWGPCGPGR